MFTISRCMVRLLNVHARSEVQSTILDSPYMEGSLRSTPEFPERYSARYASQDPDYCTLGSLSLCVFLQRERVVNEIQADWTRLLACAGMLWTLSTMSIPCV